MSSTFCALFAAVVLVVAGVGCAPVADVPDAVFGCDFGGAFVVAGFAVADFAVAGLVAAGFALLVLGFDVDCAEPDREVPCVELVPEPCERCVDEWVCGRGGGGGGL